MSAKLNTDVCCAFEEVGSSVGPSEAGVDVGGESAPVFRYSPGVVFSDRLLRKLPILVALKQISEDVGDDGILYEYRSLQYTLNV